MDEFNKMPIEELISAYLDDQLSERHKTELRRLMKHDEKLAQKVRLMSRQRSLLHALPCEKAPEHLMADIKASIERKALLDQYHDEAINSGSRHLYIRRISSMAAVFALAACLVYVIWSVVSPAPQAVLEKSKPLTIATESRGIQDKLPMPVAKSVTKEGTQKQAYAAESLSMNLKLYAADTVRLDRMISQAIYNNNLMNQAKVDRRPGITKYTITASRSDLKEMIGDLSNVFSEGVDCQLAVSSYDSVPVIAGRSSFKIRHDQLVTLLNQNDFAAMEALSYNIALSNRIAQSVPGPDIYEHIDQPDFSLPVIPKPVLTSPMMETKKTDSSNLNMTVVIEVVSR